MKIRREEGDYYECNENMFNIILTVSFIIREYVSQGILSI